MNREQASVLSPARAVVLHELRPSEPSSTVAAAIAEIRSNHSAAIMIEARRHRDSADVVRAIAATAAEIITATGVRRLFVTGGETAFALCEVLGVPTLAFNAEIEPGLSLSSAGSSTGRRWFAIKPGGFGDANTWVRAWDALQWVR